MKILKFHVYFFSRSICNRVERTTILYFNWRFERSNNILKSGWYHMTETMKSYRKKSCPLDEGLRALMCNYLLIAVLSHWPFIETVSMIFGPYMMSGNIH